MPRRDTSVRRKGVGRDVAAVELHALDHFELSLEALASSMRMGATHFLMKRLPKVATEMALHVLAYNLTRVMNIMGAQPLTAAIRA
jgi:hypothetical protein